MKAKHIPSFQIWLKAMCELDKRLKVRDFNKLFNLYKRSSNASSRILSNNFSNN